MSQEHRTSAPTNAAANLSRRRFMAGAGAAAATISLVDPRLAFSSTANSKINLGIIGCGGRGTWIAKLFQEHGGYNVVAAADYFTDRVNALGDAWA